MSEKSKFPVHGEEPKAPRSFAGKGYVMELENNLYGVFRDVLVETDKKDDQGNVIREKAGKIGPLSLLRRARDGERVVMQTFDHRTNTVILLTPVDPTTGK